MIWKRSAPALVAGTLATLALTGLVAQGQSTKDHDHPHPAKAIAVLTPTEGKKAHGVVTFTQEKDGVHIVGKFEGLAPGEHGFHIHEYGDISGADGKSAGGHYNPDKEKHAGPEDKMRHIGDLGNIKADGRGMADYERVDKHLHISGEHSILGRGLVIHEKVDDFTTQDPPGNAGGRIAVGVIGVAKGS